MTEPHGSDQNSYYNDHSNEAPLGEYFIEQWGFLPSVRQMPGYHYFDYLTQDIDPEFLEWAYAAHEAASVFAESDLSLADIENIPFQLMVDGRPITVVWHSGPAPAGTAQLDPNDPGHVIVPCANGYFSIQADPPGPSAGHDIPPPASDFLAPDQLNHPLSPQIGLAFQYLAQSPLALEVLLAAADARVAIKIVIGDSPTWFDEAHNTVEWNPLYGLELTRGGILSPAMCLIHELAHAIVRINPNRDSQYGNAEDRYVIEHFEQIIAQHLGEPLREDHLGQFKHVATVRTHTPNTR